VTQFLITCLQL